MVAPSFSGLWRDAESLPSPFAGEAAGRWKQLKFLGCCSPGGAEIRCVFPYVQSAPLASWWDKPHFQGKGEQSRRIGLGAEDCVRRFPKNSFTVLAVKFVVVIITPEACSVIKIPSGHSGQTMPSVVMAEQLTDMSVLKYPS